VTIQLYHGDCLDILPTLEDGSVDVVITDPPYYTDDNWSNHQTLSGADDARMNHKWKDDFSWLQEIPRVLKVGGQWFSFSNNDGLSFLILAAKEVGLKPLRRLTWVKTNPRPSIPRRIFRNDTESCMWGTTGGAPTYFGATDQRDALSVDHLPICGGKERTSHPTQKPLKLMMRYVRIGCPTGGVILDPFMGSGTTGVACVQTGRSFIGIELNKEYFDLAKQRIETAQPRLL